MYTRVVSLLPPAVALLGYGGFIAVTYGSYLDWSLRLRSPDLAGLPEDAIGYGFWMWWPVAALLFLSSLAVTLWANHRRGHIAIPFVVGFVLLSVADYLLCQRLIREMLGVVV